MKPTFHLSLGVPSIDESLAFFEGVLGLRVQHRDPSGYVNIDFFGSQVTLKPVANIKPDLEELHFGVNLSLADFDVLATRVLASGYAGVVMAPKTVDAGTPMERKKMYLKCPAGYLFEIKGYPAR